MAFREGRRRKSRDDDYDDDDRGSRRGKKSSDDQWKIKLTNVRISFAHVFRPQKPRRNDGSVNEEAQAKYSASFLLDKKRHRKLIERIEDKIDALMKENKVRKLPPDKICLRDGDDYDRDEYEGCMFVSANNAKKPKVVDGHREEMDDNGTLGSGDYVNAVVRLWFQNNDHGKRVNASLEGVQHIKRGERFGREGIDVDEEFDEIEDYSDGDDDDYDDDYDDEPRSRRRSRRDDDYDDEDDEPRSRRRSRKSRDDDDDDDDEDEDDGPRSRREQRRKRRRDRDEEEDDDWDDEEEDRRDRRKKRRRGRGRDVLD